jgi:hypothetical protein
MWRSPEYGERDTFGSRSPSSRPQKASSLLARLGLCLATSDIFDFLQNTVEPPSHCALALQTRGPNLPGLLEVAFVRR